MRKFSQRFRSLKDKPEMTLKELSNALDISLPNLSYYLKDREPNYDMLIKVANYFNVTVDWLVGRETDMSKIEDINNELFKENSLLKKKLEAINNILQLKE